MTALGANDVWAVGSEIEHWDGSRWHRIANPQSPPSTVLYSVATASSHDIWAAGTAISGRTNGQITGKPVIEHWDGNTWSVVPQQYPGTATLTGITATGNKVWVVGTSITGFQQVPGTLIETNC